MKRSKMSNVTVSLPTELSSEMRIFAGTRGISRFVALAVERMITEEKTALGRDYEKASKDKDRIRLIEEWEAIDFVDNKDEK